MKIVTTSQMREADAHTIASKGVNGLELMKRAGAALADEAENMLDLRGKRIRERVLVVCGGGNNGGDGFVCARILTKRGQEADVVFFAEKTSAECAEAKNRFLQPASDTLHDDQYRRSGALPQPAKSPLPASMPASPKRREMDRLRNRISSELHHPQRKTRKRRILPLRTALCAHRQIFGCKKLKAL